MSIENVLYVAKATSTGGRDGRAVSSDNVLDIPLSTPRELGGAGGRGTNPEQLFAAAYSACFLGALKFVAGKEKIALPADTTVMGKIGIGRIPSGFGIQAELRIWARRAPLDGSGTGPEGARRVRILERDSRQHRREPGRRRMTVRTTPEPSATPYSCSLSAPTRAVTTRCSLAADFGHPDLPRASRPACMGQCDVPNRD